jgi:hypothetical protein
VITQEYRTNRARFPHAELVPYLGSWVAFSGDGRRILARGETVEQLELQIAADGGNSQNVVMEWLPGAEEDSALGAGEWM